MTNFSDDQTEPLQGSSQRLNRQVRLEFRLEFPEHQVGLLLSKFSDLSNKGRPQRDPPPLEQ